MPVATYTLTDGSGIDDTSTLTISVTPVNDNFSDADELVTIDEDTLATGNVIDGSSVDGPVTVTSFTLDGDATVYSAGDTATITGVGTLVIAGDGAYTFTPNANYNGPVPVATYTLTNGSGIDDTSTLTISVTPVNDNFSDADELVTIDEDTLATGNVIDGSSVDGPVTVTSFTLDGDATVYSAGDTATITGVGTLVIAGDGAYTFTPNANYNGPVPVATYTLTDGSGIDDTSTLTISVTPVNDNFSDADELVTIDEDTLATGNVIDGSSVDGPVTVTSFTLDGDATVYSAGDTATITGVGTLVIAGDGAYTFTPNANYNGPVPVATYTLTDGSGIDDTSTLTISVTPVNDNFSDADELVTIDEDTLATGNVIDGSSVDGPVTVTSFTLDGDATVYSAGDTATITGVGTLVIAGDGAYTFTPNANYNGPVPVATYTLTDGSGIDDTSTLTISVTPVNDNFSDADELVTIDEDTLATGNVIDGSSVDGPVTVTSFTLDGDATVYSAGDTATITGVGTLVIAGDGAYTFTPNANYNGPVPVATYTLTDGSGIDDTSTLTISVTPVNDNFSDADELVTIDEDTLATGNVIDGSSVDGPVTVTSFTLDGDATVYSAGDTATITGVGTLVIAGDGAYTFTPNANYNGPVPVATYTLTDGSGIDDTSTLTISVTPVNDNFSDADELVTIDEDTLATGNVIDGSSVDGPVTVTSFTLDGDATVYSAGDTATITGVGTLVIAGDGAYTFTPNANYNGPVPVATYTLTDGSGIDDTSTLTISVTPVNDNFSDADELVTIDEDTLATGNVIDGSSVDGPVTVTSFTLDGDATVYSAGDTATITGVGTLVIAGDGAYTFTPNANYNGPVPVATYTLTDGSGIDDTSTLTISVTPVNDNFSDADELVTIDEDTLATGNVIDGSSVDGPVTVTSFTLDGDATVYSAGDTATITGVGTLVIAGDGAYTFTPNANYNGPVPVATYTLTNGSGIDDTSTLTISVTPVNDNFSDADELVTIDEDTLATGNVIDGSSVDGPVTVTSFTLDGDATVYSAGDTATITGVGTLVIAGDGAYTFTPNANYNGPVPVATYTLTDGSGIDDTSTLTISVTPVNDNFSDADELVTIDEDTLATGNVIDGSSVDGPVTVTSFTLDGDATVYSAGDTATITGVGTLVIAGDGAYTFTPNANYNGPVPVATYTLTDGSGIDDTSTLTISVTPVNDNFSDADELVTIDEDTLATGNVIDGSSVDGPVTVTSFTLDGDATVYSAGDTATITGVGTLVIAGDGAYTFTPNANYNGPVPVATYTLTDGSGIDDTSTLTISVTPVNDNFSDADELVTIDEDTLATGNVIDGSSVDGPVTVTSFTLDGDATVYSAGDTATITGVGTLVIAGDGAYTFTPNANYNGPVPVATYTLTDGSGIDDTSTLTISVTPVNDNFSDADELVTIDEDTLATGNVIDGSSVDGPVTVTSFTLDGDHAGAMTTSAMPMNWSRLTKTRWQPAMSSTAAASMARSR